MYYTESVSQMIDGNTFMYVTWFHFNVYIFL